MSNMLTIIVMISGINKHNYPHFHVLECALRSTVDPSGKEEEDHILSRLHFSFLHIFISLVKRSPSQRTSAITF